MANTGSTGTTYAHTGLSAEDTRHYRVSAINSVGTGTASDEASATTDAAATATAPGAPVSFLASLPGDRQVTLSWARPLSDGGAAITKYEYRYKTDGDYGNWRELLTIVDALSFARTVSGLTNGTPHTFQARAVNSVGGGAESNESTATPRTTPGPPTNVQAVPGVTSGSVKLSWSPPASDGGADIDRYQYRYKTTGNYNSWRGNYSGSSRSRVVTGLAKARCTPSRCGRTTAPATAPRPPG